MKSKIVFLVCIMFFIVACEKEQIPLEKPLEATPHPAMMKNRKRNRKVRQKGNRKRNPNSNRRYKLRSRSYQLRNCLIKLSIL